jgi:hypothetical protein
MAFAILTIFTVLIFLQSIISGIRIVKIGHVLSEHLKTLKRGFYAPENSFPNIILIVPVFREEKILKKALQNFSSLQYPSKKLKIVIVTTEREFEHGPIYPNSVEKTRTEIPILNTMCGYEKFIHIHYPLKNGVKSDQLNYAITELERTHHTFFSERTYIGIYDIDSRVSKDTLMLLASDSINNEFPDVYQQPSLYFNNFRSHKNLNGFLSNSFSFIQTAYALSYETYNFLKQSTLIKTNAPFFRYKMRYCIGHGLFVRWPYLKRLNLFPTPIEDTRLGHIISYLKEDIRILPVFDNAGVAKGIWESIMQTSTWFLGEALFIEDLKIARKIKPIRGFFGFWLIVYKTYRNALWILKGPMFLTLLILFFITGHFLLAGAIIFSVFFPILSFCITAKIYRTKTEETFYKFKIRDIFLVLFIPIEFILMSLGPTMGFFRFCMWRIIKKQPILYRTEK